MSVLTAIQSACAVIPLTPPEAVFSSSEREHFELQVLANTAADHIAKDCEWQKLKAIAGHRRRRCRRRLRLPGRL